MNRYAIARKQYIVPLNAGEEKTIDLPPVNPGLIDLRLLTIPGNPHTQPPTLPDAPGNNVQIGLFYNGAGRMVAPQLPLHNTTATATIADALWKLKIKNTGTAAKRFTALVLYAGPNPILIRTIPLSFFQSQTKARLAVAGFGLVLSHALPLVAAYQPTPFNHQLISNSYTTGASAGWPAF